MKKIYSTNLICIKTGSTMLDAKDLMHQKRVRHLPIINNDKCIVGILSAHDMTDVMKFQDLPVDLFASFPVKYVTPEESLSSVAFRMIVEKVSCLLVVEEEKALGLITTDDLLYELAQSLKEKEKTKNETNPKPEILSDTIITAGEFCRKLSDIGI